MCKNLLDWCTVSVLSACLSQVRCYEHADGAGKAFDLVIQGFGRYATIALIPVLLCATVVYVLVRLAITVLVA